MSNDALKSLRNVNRSFSSLLSTDNLNYNGVHTSSYLNCFYAVFFNLHRIEIEFYMFYTKTILNHYFSEKAHHQYQVQ